MAKMRKSKGLGVQGTLAALSITSYLVLSPTLAAAESLEPALAALIERKNLSRFYIEHADRTLKSRPEALQHLQEEYGAAQAAFNSRLNALISCIQRHRREGPESCRTLDLVYGIQAIDNFINKAKAALLREGMVHGKKANWREDILTHTGIAWIFDILRDFWISLSCPSCSTADELVMQLREIILPDWDEILVMKRGLACNWKSFSTPVERVTTFTRLLFDMADDAATTTMIQTERNPTNLLFPSAPRLA